MMRASMGNAVMDIAAPRNKTASKSVTFSEKRPGTLLIQSAKRPPRIKGATIYLRQRPKPRCDLWRARDGRTQRRPSCRALNEKKVSLIFARHFDLGIN